MKKKLFILSYLTVLVSVFGMMFRANAATLLDGSYKDEFANGIDTEKYTVIGDTENKFTFIDKPGQLKITGFDYANGWIRTKNAVEVPEGKSLVVQWEVVSDTRTAGYVAYNKGASDYNTAWADAVHHHATGAQLFHSNSGVLPFTPAGVQTLWQDTFVLQANALTRHVYNADGSAEYYGVAGNDPAGLVKLTYWQANSFANPNSGYFGFAGNAMAGEYIIDNFKIGYSDDSTCSNITWLLEDNFDTADNWTIESGAEKVVIGASKYLVADNPADGAGIVYNTAFAKTEGVAKLYEASINLDITSVEAGKAIGLALGLADDATTCANAPFVGLRENAAGNGELVILVNGEAAQVVDLGAPLDATAPTLKVVANVNAEGKIEIVGKVADKTISHVVDSVDGKIAIAAAGSEGSFVAKLMSLDVNSYKGVVRDGRSLSTDFEGDLNKNWHIVSKPSPETEGYVAVENGKLEFELAGDGSLFGTKYEYANFELKFDVLVQQLDEDEEGNITKASTWPGISFARPDLNSNFWDEGAKLIYFQVSTIDLLGFANNGRTWLGPDDDMHHANNFGVPFTVRLRAENGTVELFLLNNGLENAVEKKVATWENVETAGYVAICCTAGANFTIDNYSITNLDGNERVNAKPVITTEETTKAVVGGETVTGSLSATDADEDALTYALVEDNTSTHGTLTLNADGTYTFQAKADAATGTVTFKYKVTDTEDEAEGTITINVTKANVAPVINTSETTKEVVGGETVTGTLSATDADNDSLTYVLVEDKTASHGTLTLNADGTYTFVAKEDAATGTVTFTYKANDGKLDSEVATITINVTAKPAPAPQKGCKGSIASSLIAITTMLGAAIILKKKRNEE